MKEITLNGKSMIGTVIKVQNGIKMIGLMIAKTSKERPVNSTDPRWRKGKQIRGGRNVFVVWIPELESARVLQDSINLITLELNNYENTTKSK